MYIQGLNGGSRRISAPPPQLSDPPPVIWDPPPCTTDPAPFCWDPQCQARGSDRLVDPCHCSTAGRDHLAVVCAPQH